MTLSSTLPRLLRTDLEQSNRALKRSEDQCVQIKHQKEVYEQENIAWAKQIEEVKGAAGEKEKHIDNLTRDLGDARKRVELLERLDGKREEGTKLVALLF